MSNRTLIAENEHLEFYNIDATTELLLPLFLSNVNAGFPSPADDFIDQEIDLNKYLIRNPPATFMVKVKGDSMIDCNIFEGDLLIVDRSLDAKDNCIVLATLDGEFTVKRLRINNGQYTLIAENKSFKPILISPESSFEIWGVVINTIHKTF